MRVGHPGVGPWLAGLAVGLAAGCGTGGDGCPGGDDGGGPPWIEVGTGEWRFEPLEDGQDVPLVFGSQGGYHVWVSYRTGGLDPVDVRIEIATEILSHPDTRTASILTRTLPQADEPGVYGQIGWPAVVPQAGCADGEPVEVEVRLEDRHGMAVRDARTVVPHASVEPPECHQSESTE
jgi:hypothetical protein